MKPPTLANRLRGRVNKIRGDQAEQVVGHRLRALGFHCVVRLETGWRVHRAGGRILGATPMAKVTGDFRAVGPGGRSVLVEVKSRGASVLRLSDFPLHQRQALLDHALHGGDSLVAWVSRLGVAIFLFSAAFIHKGSLTWADAQALAITGA